MITKRILSACLFILSLIYFTSCDDIFDERVEGNSTLITKTREIYDFDEIANWGVFDVYVTLADSTSLMIEAEENLIPFIETYVSGQKFYVKEKEGYNLDNNKPIKIFLTTPNLEGAKLLGSGLIRCDSLSGDFFSAELLGSGNIEFYDVFVNDVEAEITGSGDVILSGEGVETEYTIIGSGNIRAIGFMHENSESTIAGSGNIYVYATDYLKATIPGSGYIYYEGNPVINENITGSGDVRKY